MTITIITVIENGEEKYIARTVKSFDDVNNERQIEKFEIERRYWKDRNIDWGIITDRKINRILADNVNNVYHAYDLNSIDGFENMSDVQRNKLVLTFRNMIYGYDIIVREKTTDFEEKMILKPGTGILLFKHLLITKQVKMNSFLNTNLNIAIDTPQDIFLNKNYAIDLKDDVV